MTYRPVLTAQISGLSNEAVIAVATQAAKDSSEVSGVAFVHCMRELAARFDRRSFINICEAIHRDLPYAAA